MAHQIALIGKQVRLPPVSMPERLAPDWNGGDAFMSAWCDALSLSFPVAERYFVESLRSGLASLAGSKRHAIVDGVRLFCGQEAMHSRIHLAYNRALDCRGVENRIGPRIAARFARMTRLITALGGNPVRYNVAVTAALEHCTALLGHLAITRAGTSGDPLAGAAEPMLSLWRWHAAEEIEHGAIALGLYRAMGGGAILRRAVFLAAGWFLVVDMARQTITNLAHSGGLWRGKTWRSAARFLFGAQGFVWLAIAHSLAYFRPGFQPGDPRDLAAAQAWLSEHGRDWAVRLPQPADAAGTA